MLENDTQKELLSNSLRFPCKRKDIEGGNNNKLIITEKPSTVVGGFVYPEIWAIIEPVWPCRLLRPP